MLRGSIVNRTREPVNVSRTRRVRKGGKYGRGLIWSVP